MIEAQEVYKHIVKCILTELKRGYLVNFSYLVLDEYLGLSKNCKEEFEMWVENVPCFMEFLWQMRELNYIEKFNKMAFDIANKLNIKNNDGCLVLVDLFSKYATWKDNPSDFALTIENLKWLEKDCFQNIFLWIKTAPFLTESDFLLLNLKN